MIIFKTRKELQLHLRKKLNSSQNIGFIPTMGALHEGHLSLIKTAKEYCSVTVCSIFVNPTQFNDINDFNQYPSSIADDILKLEIAKCSILFLPSVSEVYGEDGLNKKHYELGELENILEGKYRPNHFQGVCQVIEHLLAIVTPTHLFLGQKDYQQCLVIKKLTELLGLDKTIDLIICPTFRESNGLAMSSRNMRLSNNAKELSKVMYESLLFIKDNVFKLDFLELKSTVEARLLESGFDKIDYVDIADAENLYTLDNINSLQAKKLVALIAAFTEGVRLIDNIVFDAEQV